LKAYYFEWYDSCGFVDTVWADKKHVETLKPHLVRSYGVVVKEDKDFVTVAGHYGEDEFCGCMCIPKSVIIKRKRIK
jgi:hypothetical protein